MTNPGITVPASGIQTVKPLSNGQLRVRGMAALWDSMDRQHEYFAAGAFSGTGGAIDRFMNAGTQPLCWHHQHGKPIGRVDHLAETGEGLAMDAVVNYQEPMSPLRAQFTAIATGAARSLSVGGFFSRSIDPRTGRPHISSVDLSEVSITPVPVDPRTFLRVIEVGPDPWDDLLAKAQLAVLRAELFAMSKV